MKLRDFRGLDRAILIYFCAVQLFAFQANLFRLSGVEYFEAVYFDHVFLGSLLVALVSVSFAQRAELVEAPFAMIILVFCAFILTVGVLRSNDNPINGLRYFALPIFAYLLLRKSPFVLYFYNSKPFWILLSVAHVVGLLYYFTTLFGMVYPGIGVQSIAYAAIFFFCHGHFGLFALAVLVVFLEGKRSIMLSLLLAIMFLRGIRYKPSLRLFYFIISGSATMLILSIGLMLIADIEGNIIISRINYINPFSNSYDLFIGSSGRFGEIASYFGDVSFVNLMVGSGAGFQYEWALGYASEQDGEVKGYMHMSAANYLAAGGVFGLFVFAIIALMPFRARKLRVPFAVQRTAFGMGLFTIVQSFFGFILATDMVSWIFILGPAMLLAHKTLHASNKSDYSIFETASRRTAS